MKVLFCYKNAEWLGVEYLSSVLKEAGHTTELVFESGAGDLEFKFSFLENHLSLEGMMLNKAKRFAPDLIAFSCLTNIYKWVDKMAAIFKRELNKPVIVGGIHPTLAPEQVINNKNIDMICLGEGEDAMLELANSMEQGKVDYSIKNIWFKKNGAVIKNPLRPLRMDLDELPFPDKDIFYKYGCFKDRLYIMTSRGCPYDCTYCFNHSYKKLYNEKRRYVRRRSVDNVIAELLFFQERYPLKEVFFYDDIFTLQRKWVDDFCEAYREKVHLPFKCLIRPGTVDIALLEKLKDAGLRYVDIGLESGAVAVRENILNRKMTDSQIIDTCKMLRQVGIQFTTLNLVGMPGETKEDMEKTLLLNQKIMPTTAIFSTFYPFPSTKLSDKAFEDGYISGEDREKVIRGEGSYKEKSMLRHPEADVIKWMATFSPILIKFPRLTPFVKNFTPNRFFRFLTIFFSSPLRNVKIRTFELIRMFIKTRRTLLLEK